MCVCVHVLPLVWVYVRMCGYARGARGGVRRRSYLLSLLIP